MKKLIVCIFAVLLSACGGSYSVVRTNATAPQKLQAVSLVPTDNSSAEVDGYMNAAIVEQGLILKSPLPKETRKNIDVDAIVSYQDVWKWDMTTYLYSINIYLYNAMTGDLLVTGKWEDSFFHRFERGNSVVPELIKQMLEKVRANK